MLFPTISRLAARDDIDGMRRTLADGLRQIFFMLLPASAFLLVLSEPVVRLVFQRGEFDAESTSLTSEALFFFAIGLAFNGASLLVIRAFFSLQRPWLPTKVAALGVVLNAALRRDLLPAPRAPAASRSRPRCRASSPSRCMLWLLERELGGLHRAWLVDGAVRGAGGERRVGAAGVVRPGGCSTTALGRRHDRPSSSAWRARSRPRRSPTWPAAQAFEMPELTALSRLGRPLR